MKGVIYVFNKLIYAYHLNACEKMIEKYKYIDHSTYELTKKFKWHRKKLNELMTKVNNK